MQLAARPRVAPDSKQEITRNWLAAGVAVASAGMIAVAPGLSPVPATIQHDLQASAVRLTAGWDPLAAWKVALDTAQTGATTLFDNFALAPGVGLQQALVNQAAFIKQVVDDPSSAKAVAQQFVDNARKVSAALTLQGLDLNDPADKAIFDTVTKHTTSGLHGFLITALPGFLPEGTDTATVTSVLQLLASPLSGVLIGMAGPLVSPAVALLNSAQAVSDAINAKDASAAFTALLDTPASMAGAFLNGADLHLDGVAALLGQAGVLPAGTSIDKLDIAFGGLLTPGTSGGYTYEVKDEDGNVIKSIPSPGGSILNSLGLTITTDALGAPFTLDIASAPVGPIGALQGLSQTVGVLLGDGWDTWDGKGNPPAPDAPIFSLSDIADSVNVTKLRDLLKGAAVDNFAKKLQGLATGTETTTDTIATDSSAAGSVAGPTELTHATTNKMVAVSLKDVAASSDTTNETTGTDEPADPTAPAMAGEKTSSTTIAKSGVVKGLKDAVKNVRKSLGADNPRKSGETGSGTSSSSASSSSSSSPKASGSDSSATGKHKKDSKTKHSKD